MACQPLNNVWRRAFVVRNVLVRPPREGNTRIESVDSESAAVEG